MHSADLILPRLRWRLEQAVPFPPEVLPARFLENASLYGAVALALDDLASSKAKVGAEARPEASNGRKLKSVTHAE
jgi:hypothetical protein